MRQTFHRRNAKGDTEVATKVFNVKAHIVVNDQKHTFGGFEKANDHAEARLQYATRMPELVYKEFGTRVFAYQFGVDPIVAYEASDYGW
jgi:hypothetical protein